MHRSLCADTARLGSMELTSLFKLDGLVICMFLKFSKMLLAETCKYWQCMQQNFVLERFYLFSETKALSKKVAR